MGEKIYLGAGCFWGVQEGLRKLKGVLKTEVGYSGGRTPSPTYEDVCRGDSGHVEVCLVEYEKGALEGVLSSFFEIHDPTQVNQQGPDRGEQYRSVIFTTTDEQSSLAQKIKDEIEKSGKYSSAIATSIEDFRNYTKAEDYHQDYAQRKGWSCRF